MLILSFAAVCLGTIQNVNDHHYKESMWNSSHRSGSKKQCSIHFLIILVFVTSVYIP